MLLTYLFYPFLKPYQVTSMPKPKQTATSSHDNYLSTTRKTVHYQFHSQVVKYRCFGLDVRDEFQPTVSVFDDLWMGLNGQLSASTTFNHVFIAVSLPTKVTSLSLPSLLLPGFILSHTSNFSEKKSPRTGRISGTMCLESDGLLISRWRPTGQHLSDCFGASEQWAVGITGKMANKHISKIAQPFFWSSVWIYWDTPHSAPRDKNPWCFKAERWHIITL